MSVRISFLGHATVLIEMNGLRLLTDPLLRPRLLHLRRVGKIDSELARAIDVVLVSHLHFDHLDIASLRTVGRDVPVVVPQGAGRLLRKRGFSSVQELAVGGEIAFGDVVVRGVPAVHDRARLPFGTRADPLGHVIAGERSVYFAGDTDVFPAMAELGPLDVALLPIWGWGPSLGVGHMNPRGAAEAARMLRASVVIPIHWGTYFPLQSALRGRPAFLERPAEEFATHMRALVPDVEVRILQVGEATTV